MNIQYKLANLLKLIVVISFFASCSDLAEKTNNVSDIYPDELICEYRKNPTVVDELQPRVSWINKATSDKRGLSQSAYQIKVATTKEKLSEADLWDSEKVDSDVSIRVKYAGQALESRQECWWQVRVWDQAGNVSDWSEPNYWRMGLLQPRDWQATWIGAPWQGEAAFPKPDGGPNGVPEDFGPPAPLLRKSFNIDKQVAKAVAYVTGLGYFEIYANGQKVGDDVLIPNQTNYGKRPNLSSSSINVPDQFTKYKVMYLAYDISDLLKEGENVIGSILGNGFYNPAKFWTEGYGTPRFLGQVHITYTDGSEEVIVSDESWQAAKSPILMNMVYYGEDYDARKEIPGWNNVGFDASEWEQVEEKKAPEGELVAHTAYPDKITERLEPVALEKLGDGHYKVDFGVEISGWVRLNEVEGPAGHKVEITFNSNQYSGDNSYIFAGNGKENYAPRFNWFVFSGIEIKNWPGELKPEHLTAEAVNTYVEATANFETSNQLFNDINNIWRRSQIDNMHGGIASDCPHRERSGYTGDGQVACATVIHNYDAKNFYQKWISDMRDAQIKETGYVPNGAPWQPGCGGGVAWGAAICIMPWEYYVHYGDKEMLADNYEAMKGYIKYMQTWVGDDGIMFSQRIGGDGEILKWFNLGEWVSPGELIPDDLVHTFYFWRCVDVATETAKILGKTAEAENYAILAENTKAAFHQRFFKENLQTYGNGGANILALRMGVPDEVKSSVLKALKENITANNGHLDTGIFGTRFFFEMLAANGLNDLAYEALNKKTEPSFGHWLTLGATTTREKWDTGGSHNHPMFGGGLVWLYRNLAGMQANPEKPGYKEIIFKPQPIKELDFVTYSNKTVYGDAGITWTNKENGFSMEVTIPIGSTAQVYVPTTKKDNITESGKNLSSNQHITFKREEEGYAVFEVKSGKYTFLAQN